MRLVFDPNSGEQRTVHAYSISAKRYCLYQAATDHGPAIIKRSEHGLGHLLPPVDDGSDWQTEWWRHAVRLDLGLPSADPAWFGDIAAGRLTISSPHEQNTWAIYNKTKGRAERVGPHNFAMTAHQPRLHRSQDRRALIAPLSPTPAARSTATWIAKNDPDTPLRVRTGCTGDTLPGTVRVLSYGDYFDEYRSRPEYKALGPDGERCHAWTRGLLRPQVIQATSLERIGKETTIGADDEPDPSLRVSPQITYAEPRCPACGGAVDGKRVYCSDRCRKRARRPT